MRLEEVRFEADGALVQRLRFDELVAAVVDVREVDDRGHEVRIELERLAVRLRRILARQLAPVVERRAGAEVFLGERRVARFGGAHVGRRGPARRAAQLEDFRRRGLEPEIEGQLAVA